MEAWQVGLTIRICSRCGDANALAFQDRESRSPQVHYDTADITIAVLCCEAKVALHGRRCRFGDCEQVDWWLCRRSRRFRPAARTRMGLCEECATESSSALITPSPEVPSSATMSPWSGSSSYSNCSLTETGVATRRAVGAILIR